MPSVQELLLRILSRLEKAPPVLASTVLAGPSLALADPAMIYVGPSLVLDPPMTFMIPP